MTVNATQDSATGEGKEFLLDPYKEWAQGEGIPIHLDFGHDLIALETGAWDRYDARGCFAFTHGAGDFMSNYVIEVPAGQENAAGEAPLRSLLLCAGRPRLDHRVAAERRDPQLRVGAARLVRGPAQLPISDLQQFGVRAGAGFLHARRADLAQSLSQPRFRLRQSVQHFPIAPGCRNISKARAIIAPMPRPWPKGIRNVWETNFVHDLTSFKLYELEARGKGSTNVSFILADGTMHAHCSQIPAGRYKKAHRHAAGTHVHAVDGEGYSLLWYEGDSEFKEFPVAAWLHVHAAVLDVPPALQHLRQAGALSRLQPRQPALSVHFAAAQELGRRRLGLGAAGRPSDRVRGSGSRASTASGSRRYVRPASSREMGDTFRRAGDSRPAGRRR